MASPDAFLSSPARARRWAAQAALSSSPGLPSVQDILSQKPQRPPLKSGSKAATIPEKAPTTFTTGGRLLGALRADDLHEPGSNATFFSAKIPEEIDTSASIVEIRPQEAPEKEKPRRRKRAPAKRVDAPVQSPTESDVLPENQPWKKYKPPDKGAVDATTEPKYHDAQGLNTESALEDNVAQARSCYFKSPEPQSSTKKNLDKKLDQQPLNLEVAVARRTDWTPPAKNTQVIIDCGETPKVEGINSSQRDSETSKPFESVLASFICSQSLKQETCSNTASEISGLVKKRKLLEMVPTNLAKGSESANQGPPSKQKAPRKKTRTITGIATAAYRPQTQPDLTTAPVAEELVHEGTRPAGAGATKAKPRKRSSKVPKKKAPPPKPILLSPSAALKQVARQDFVFGTSSQLAREQSPTLLRDLQAVMRASNQLDLATLATPLNSDAMEPPEERQTLWDAGARDADGDLFDVEVRNFVDGSGICELTTDGDPFGYVQCDADDARSLPKLQPVGEAHDDGSFVNLSDILPPLEQEENLGIIHISSEDEPPAHAASPEDTTHPSNNGGGTSIAREGEDARRSATHSDRQLSPVVAEEEMSLELCSDAQLAKQVAQYGFKPIKKRAVMIALLTECRQGALGPGRGVAASAFTTTTGSCRSASTAIGAVSKAKGRRSGGKKASASEDDLPKPPPPSAQPAEAARRPRGRPRKNDDSAAAVPASTSAKPSSKNKQPPPPRASASKPAKQSPEDERPAPRTPKRKTKEPKIIIEIPDSQSEDEGNPTPSPSSSIEATFSPDRPMDMSLIVDEDAEASLATSPTEQQRCLFTYMTKAVVTAPRTTDPAQPSWHEKILMYDAIVLEDFTTWLNCGQLTRVGWDGEASVSEVKRWCESKSILCLWEDVARQGKEAWLRDSSCMSGCT